MSNKGLKNGCKQLEKQIANFASTFINLNNDDANLIINIPLIKTIGSNSIEISLIYNYQNRNIYDPYFGYGFRLNLYSYIESINNNLKVTTADGAEYLYIYDSSNNIYKNPETSNYIRIETINSVQYYFLYDKYANYKKFNISNNGYPVAIKYNGLPEISISLASGIYINISNNITFLGSPINKITYKYYSQNDNVIDITYSNNKISNLKYKLINDIKEELNIILSDDQIMIDDLTKKHRVTFSLTNGKVTLIEDRFYHYIDNQYLRNTLINYYDRKTYVTDYLGNITRFYFNDDGIPIYEMDDKNNIKYYEFNSKNLLTFDSNIIKTYPKKTSIIGSNLDSSYTTSGITKAYTQITDNIFSPILGGNAYTLSGSGTISKTITLNGIKGESYTFVMFCKKNTSSGSVSVSLNYGGVISSSQIKNTSYTDFYEAVVIGIYMDTSVTNLTLTIYINNTTAIIGGLQLLKKNFGTYYTYDNENNITSILNNEGHTINTYTTYGRMNSQTTPDGEIKTISYSYLKISEVISSYGYKINNTYMVSSDNLMTTKYKDINNNIELYEENIYSNNGAYLASYNNVDNLNVSYEYSSNGIDTIAYGNRVLYYDYYSNGDLYKIEDNYNTSNKTEYTYDTRKNISKIETNSNNEIKFEFNELNERFEVTHGTNNNNDILISQYNYDSNKFINKISYGLNSDSFNIYYNNNHEISSIYYQYQNNGTSLEIYSFEYNIYDELSKIKDKDGNTLKEFMYNIDENIISISNSSYEYRYTYDKGINISSKLLTINNKSNIISYSDDFNYNVAIYTNHNNNIYSQYEIYPLHKTVKSINDLSPIIFNYDNQIKPFILDDLLNHNVLDIYNVKLVYRFGFTTTGTMFIRMKVSSTNKQYIFNNVDSLGNSINLYVNNLTLYVEVNGMSYNTSLTMTSSSWNKVGLSFKETTSSGGLIINKNIRVYLNGSIYQTNVVIPDSFESITSYIGRSNNDTYKLIGYVEYLTTKEAYITSSTFTTLSNLFNTTSIKNTYDVLDRIKKKEIKLANSQILKHEYNYKIKENTSYSTKTINNEVISYSNNSITRSYTYDGTLRVTKITNSNTTLFKDSEYTYDSRGFLVSEKYDGTTYTYTYDENGNITNAQGVSLTYDTNIKDRLISVGGQPITYTSNNPLNPTSFNGWSYSYEGRRLVRATTSDNYSMTIISFTYDEEGNIIKKNYLYIPYDDEDEINETTLYYYESNRLVTEITPSVRNDYLYDSEGNLIGFIKDNTTKYFYIKDILSNIIGIIDESGTLITRYYYDAYGYRLIISGNTSVYNPFRYKGYYYDNDLLMYYCKTRFYVPYWRRWLNSDNVEYLDYKNVGCVNLFAYCNNNPVMYSDGSGHFAFFVLTAIIGAVIGGVAAGVTSYQHGARGWEVVGWSALGAAGGGLIGAGIGAFAAGALAGSFTASCGAVKAGAVATYAMAKAGGLGAAGYMVYDNLKNATHYTTHVFWSGGELSMNGGSYLSSDVGGTTLEMTKLGQYLTNHNSSYEAWRIASANFANQVPSGGTVFAVQNMQGVGITSTWATTEYPILVKKGAEIVWALLGCL